MMNIKRVISAFLAASLCMGYVYAEKIVNNNLGEIETIPVFAECKAYKNPCNKFRFSKIYVH